MTMEGALLFGRFAFPPNQLGYCGPPDHPALLQYVSEEKPDQGLVELGRRFDGAFPYLCLIAHGNGIADPFDQRVVEAYWIGNRLLGGAGGKTLYNSLQERFGQRISGPEFAWLVPKLEAGAHPHHNFHVFDINTRAGHHREVRTTVAVEALDSCRISWGNVTKVEADQLVLKRQPLRHGPGGLYLDQEEVIRVTRQVDGRGLATGVEVGDAVAVHWGWACMKLDKIRKSALEVATSRCLAWANQTM
jgi:hypothetical protein